MQKRHNQYFPYTGIMYSTFEANISNFVPVANFSAATKDKKNYNGT